MKILFYVLAGIIFASGAYWGVTNSPRGQSAPLPKADQPTVPLPSAESIIHTFFSLIAEKRVPGAVSLLDTNLAPDESARQAWGVQFNEVTSLKIISIEPWAEESWTENNGVFKVVLSVDMSEKSAGATIPYYGWDGDPDTRWVAASKNGDGLWKITEIATGP